MRDECPKCRAKMWHFYHWLAAALCLTNECPPCDDGYGMHQIDGPTCLRNQLAQRDKELVETKAENKRLWGIIGIVMTAHWDMKCCDCWLCRMGRVLKCHPVDMHLKGPTSKFRSSTPQFPQIPHNEWKAAAEAGKDSE